MKNTDTDPTPDNQWHLDKKVPLSLIFAMLVQAAMVALAQAAGKRVLLVGVIATATGETDDFDLAVERTADAHGTGFVDVRAVPYTLPDDLADAVHPAQAWSDRITALIAKSLGA
jgi:hypothetical protein